MPLLVAIVGMLFPSALFVDWLVFEFESVGARLGHQIARALLGDA